jgi:hypothetical protein
MNSLYMAAEYDVKKWMQIDMKKERELECPRPYVGK